MVLHTVILAWIMIILAVYFAQNASYALSNQWNIAIDRTFTAELSIRYVEGFE
jgi:hypothetical protein